MASKSICNIKCLQIIGPTAVSINTTETYEIYMEFPETYCESFNQKLTVWLSYGGSDIKNGIDFYGPEKIIFEIGETSKTFPITFLDSCDSIENKILKITLKADYTENICSNMDIKISCSHFDYENKPVIPESNCGELFFFDPYNHKTKTSNNMK